jgi:hypothetical protein
MLSLSVVALKKKSNPSILRSVTGLMQNPLRDLYCVSSSADADWVA